MTKTNQHHACSASAPCAGVFGVFTPGARVRLRRDAAFSLSRPVRQWALEARHGTVEQIGTAGVVVRFDSRRSPRHASHFLATVEPECLEALP